jgi:protein-tyrosine kinase
MSLRLRHRSYETLLARCPQTTNGIRIRRTMLFFDDDERRAGAEEFRTLRSRLYQIREKMPLKRLLVTSALPKEGKSFVACQSGTGAGAPARAARAGDRRRSAQSRHAPPSGNASRLRDSPTTCWANATSSAALQRGPMENLFFMPAGRVVPSAPELLANGRLKLLLQRVEPLFDWIILDSSPVIPVSDSTLVAGVCDGMLMVVRSNVTPSDMARRAREEFPDKLLLGVVLNGAPSGKLAQIEVLLWRGCESASQVEMKPRPS